MHSSHALNDLPSIVSKINMALSTFFYTFEKPPHPLQSCNHEQHRALTNRLVLQIAEFETLKLELSKIRNHTALINSWWPYKDVNSDEFNAWSACISQPLKQLAQFSWHANNPCLELYQSIHHIEAHLNLLDINVFVHRSALSQTREEHLREPSFTEWESSSLTLISQTQLEVNKLKSAFSELKAFSSLYKFTSKII